MKQSINAYTNQDKHVWNTLFERQERNLNGKVCAAYANALQNMQPVLNAKKIPDFREINAWFAESTGWEIAVVPGLIPVDDFFRLLAHKQFPSSTWLRHIDQLDYLEEPDMFHDTFGHIPLLADPVFSDFMQGFGALGCQWLHDPEKLAQLQRLYWFTIEFGLLGETTPLIYGAGIISSFGETNRAVSGKVAYRSFVPEIVLNSTFRTDVVQDYYVCIDGFDHLFNSLHYLEATWMQMVGN